MSITLVTGTPGAGKTLYTVQELLAKLVGSLVEVINDKGEQHKIERTVYTNIRGLLLDHVLIDYNGPLGADHWHEWAKPGDILVVDEVQLLWPVRPNGSKVPPDVSALDTHRHRGVDFIVITQVPTNFDRHVSGLVDRHIHVRRIGRSRNCIVYEWDAASRQLRYKDAMNRRPWRYKSSTFKLYKSSELHTKMPRKLPGILWLAILALLAAPFLWVNLAGRITSKSVQPIEQAALPRPPVPGRLPAGAVEVDLASPLLAEDPRQLVVGGWCGDEGRCRCYGPGFRPVDVPDCAQLVASGRFDLVQPAQTPFAVDQTQPLPLPPAQGQPASREGAGVSAPYSSTM